MDRESWLDDGDVVVYHGDCIEVLADLDEASVDAVVTDPPYSLSFMGRDWDTHGSATAYQDWCREWAREALRVLKPGGHLLAFGGTRTSHRLVCGLEDAGFEIRDTIDWLYASGFPKSLDVSKAIDKAAGAEREVVGVRPDADKLSFGGKHEGWDRPWMRDDEALERSRSLTAPATPDAERWQGWGTALKPAWESITIATKPGAGTDTIGSCLSRLYVSIAALSSASSQNDSDAAASDGALSTADAPANTSEGSSGPTDTSPSASATATSLSIVSSWLNTWVAIYEATSTSTTATESSQIIDSATLRSCLSRITPADIIQAATRGYGSTPLVDGADNLFAAGLANLKLTQSRSALASAIAAAPTWQGAEAARRFSPAHEPIVVARKPLVGTVAVNVLEHGTGALNIDGCRVGPGHENGTGRDGEDSSALRYTEHGATNFAATPGPRGGSESGRWPANVILDEAAAAMLDEQTGELTSGARSTGIYGGIGTGEIYGDGGPTSLPAIEANTGGASRFFYTAKASPTERAGSKHPTVKPLALMRWLVRLVTPPLVLSCPSCYNTGHGNSTTPASGASPVRDVRGGVSATGQPAEAPVLLKGVRGGSTAEDRTTGLPGVRDDVPALASRQACAGVLQQGVLDESHWPGEAETGRIDQSEGLRPGAGSRASDGEPRRLCDGAPANDGRNSRADADSGRGCASPERAEGGQSAGESGSDAEATTRPEVEAAAEADRLSALWGLDRGQRACSTCGTALVDRPGLILDPFAGSGTTLQAARLEGFRSVGIEREAEYLPDIARRLSQLTLGGQV